MRKISIKMVKEEDLDYGIDTISSPEDVYEILKQYIGYCDREKLVVLCLNVRNNINAINTVSIGTINASLGQPREIFKPAILSNSASIILGHNHPSGNTEPSNADIKLTKRVSECGDLLGIELLDHIIISDNNFCSLKEEEVF